MAGYHGFHMSNNAVSAYENGEKPLSRWTKTDILAAVKNAVENGEITLTCSMELLKKVPAKQLKTLCLSRSSWHHTGSRYAKTDFYSIDAAQVENLTDSQLKEACLLQEETPPAEEKWKCAFLEWKGSRKHPKAVEIIETGIIRGNWFIRDDGTKKKTSAKGFRFLERVS